MNALVYGSSGSGKTVNSTLVKTGERGRNLLICTDNSSVVLRNFDRPNLDVVNVNNMQQFVDEYRKGYESKKYDNIILDCISDYFDMSVLELEATGKYRDGRQIYLIIYQNLKRLARESAFCGCNTIFTAWSDLVEIPQPDGSKVSRLQPKLPMKILDNFLGLQNAVALVTNADDNGKKRWYYITEGSPAIMAKDQIANRKWCNPEDLFV